MQIMKRVLSGLVVAALLPAAAALSPQNDRRNAGEIRLAEGGKTDYKIVVDAAAPLPVQFAAEELQTFLKESTDADFPIVSAATGPAIEVGTEKARAIVSEVYPRPFKVETSAVVTKDGTIAIWGAGEAGHAYGVYQFLERVVGCRWFTIMGENLVPKHPRLVVEDLKLIERPKLDYRMLLTFGEANDRDANDHLFLFRNRINQVSGNYENVLRTDLKGRLPVRMRENIPNCHSFFRYVPPEGRNGYFKEHPEYFSLGKNGKREPRQLCFANPGLRKTLTENFLAHAKKVGGRGFLDLSQQDAGGEMCLCDACRALTRKYKSTGGPLFDYLFEVAPKVKAAFPELVIHFLAYHKDSTQPPPVMEGRFPDNVAAVFAPFDDDFSKDLSHSNNVDSLNDLRNWCKLCKVWTWSYPTVYTEGNPPFGGLGRSAADLRLGVEAGLTGSYHEHDVGTGYGANFADAQTWLLVQGFRDPYRDWRALRKEFCDFYYGAASGDVVEYEEFLERGREAMTTKLGFPGRADAFFTPEDYVEWERRFDAMEHKVGGDPLVVQRLREVRLGLDAAVLANWKVVSRKVSNVGFTTDDVYARATNAYCLAVERRFTASSAGKRKANLLNDEKGFLAYLKNAHFISTVTPKALPDELKSVPEDRVMQIFPGSSHFLVDRVRMDDAASGFAQVERNVLPEHRKLPFKFGFYDRVSKKRLLSGKIDAPDIVPGKFHLYKLGRSAVPSGECQIWMGWSWRMNQLCQQMFRPGMDDEWDIYVSLKFEGPEYDPSSTLRESNVYYDRLVFVGPFPR